MRSEQIVGEWFDHGGGRRNETFLATKVHGRVATAPNFAAKLPRT